MSYYLNTKSGLTGPVIEDKIRELFANGRVKDETPLYNHAGEYLSSVSELLNAPPEPLPAQDAPVEAAYYLNTKSGLSGPVIESKIRELFESGRIKDETPLYDHTGEHLLTVSELLYVPESSAEPVAAADAAYYLNGKNGLVGPMDTEKLLSLLLASKVKPETPVYDAAGNPCGAVSDFAWQEDPAPAPEAGGWEPEVEEAPAAHRPAAPRRGRSSNLPSRGASRPRTMPSTRTKSRGKGGTSHSSAQGLHLPINNALCLLQQFFIGCSLLFVVGFVGVGLTSDEVAEQGGSGLLIIMGLVGVAFCVGLLMFERWVHQGVKNGSSGRTTFQKFRCICTCLSIVGALIGIPALRELNKAQESLQES